MKKTTITITTSSKRKLLLINRLVNHKKSYSLWSRRYKSGYKRFNSIPAPKTDEEHAAKRRVFNWLKIQMEHITYSEQRIKNICKELKIKPNLIILFEYMLELYLNYFK